MSTHIKINTVFLLAILSWLSTAGYIIWLAGQKANDIETAKLDIVELHEDVGQLVRLTERLDEKSTHMTSLLDTVESRLHGIATQIGQVRSEANARSD